LIPTGEPSSADAHRDDGKRFVVHADEKLTAFMELESPFRLVANWLDKQGEILSKLDAVKRIPVASFMARL
jgi:hypothetical protein